MAIIYIFYNSLNGANSSSSSCIIGSDHGHGDVKRGTDDLKLLDLRSSSPPSPMLAENDGADAVVGSGLYVRIRSSDMPMSLQLHAIELTKEVLERQGNSLSLMETARALKQVGWLVTCLLACYLHTTLNASDSVLRNPPPSLIAKVNSSVFRCVFSSSIG